MRVKNKVREAVARNVLVTLAIWISLQTTCRDNLVASAGKSASRSGVVGTATKVDGSAFNNKQDYAYVSGGVLSGRGASVNFTGLSPTERLRSRLLNRYDKSMPPVKDHRQSIKVQMDITYRQVLDLDEKNQILKSLVWYRQYWKDEHFTWDPSQYEGLHEMSIPSASIWRPDITVYEEVGTRDFNPRLPFVKVNSKGEVLYAEPAVIETSCKVDTAFFPFDYQLCYMTFVSWTLPVTRIDLSARRDSESTNGETKLYFIDSGEWVLTNFQVKKQIKMYFIGENTPDENLDYEVYKQKFDLPPTAVTTPELVGNKNLTTAMYAEVSYRIVIRRNSSLYMQSMLFPSILLTSVALLGFYLPPDSGERVGLQITILLTFMVFLLTVGEMFPASTGPYLGIYFVLSMAQLGINIFMTVVVLHLHFKPCVQPNVPLDQLSPWSPSSEGSTSSESVIPVNLRRVLQFFNRYIKIADDGVAWMLPIRKREERAVRTPNNAQESARVECTPILNCEKTSNQGSDVNIFPERTTTINHISQQAEESNGIHPPPCEYVDDSPIPSELALSPVQVITVSPDSMMKAPEVNNLTLPTTPKMRKKDVNKRGGSKTNSICSPARSSISESKKGIRALMDSFRIDVKSILRDRTRDDKLENDDEEEKKREADQEEWKSVARAVDRLFFRLYLSIMFLSYLILAAVALRSHFEIDWDGE